MLSGCLFGVSDGLWRCFAAGLGVSGCLRGGGFSACVAAPHTLRLVFCPVIPAQAGILFPLRQWRFKSGFLLHCQDSRLRGNDGSLRFLFFRRPFRLPCCRLAGGCRIRKSDLRVADGLLVFELRRNPCCLFSGCLSGTARRRLCVWRFLLRICRRWPAAWVW